MEMLFNGTLTVTVVTRKPPVKRNIHHELLVSDTVIFYMKGKVKEYQELALCKRTIYEAGDYLGNLFKIQRNRWGSKD